MIKKPPTDLSKSRVGGKQYLYMAADELICLSLLNVPEFNMSEWKWAEFSSVWQWRFRRIKYPIDHLTNLGYDL